VSRRVTSKAAGRGLFSPFAAWFPGNATILLPYFGCCSPLSEPCLRYLRTRLPTWSFTQEQDQINICPPGRCWQLLLLAGRSKHPRNSTPCGLSRLYDAVLFPLFSRYWERAVCLHIALPCVVSFPPAELPAFSGTMKRSDSPAHSALPPSYSCQGRLPSLEACFGPPGLPHCRYVMHAMVSDPGETSDVWPV
jgi:hypothetical protein